MGVDRSISISVFIINLFMGGVAENQRVESQLLGDVEMSHTEGALD